MVGIDAELAAAEQASGALSRSPANPVIIQTLRKAYITAKRANSNLSGGLALNGARHAVGITFPDLIRAIENGQPVGEKFNSAKYAVEVWIEVLKTQPASLKRSTVGSKRERKISASSGSSKQ